MYRIVGKISAQPHTTLCIQFLNRENNDKNNTFPLGKQICFTIVWGCAETLPNCLETLHQNGLILHIMSIHLTSREFGRPDVSSGVFRY